MIRCIFIFLLIVICNSCCTKKLCTGDDLPAIYIDFTGLTYGQPNQVEVISLTNDVVTDSVSYNLGDGTLTDSVEISIYPFDERTVTNKSYRIRWNGKVETLTGVTCDFIEKKIDCNTCFLIFKDKTKIKTFKNFQYSAGSTTIHNRQRLFLHW